MTLTCDRAKSLHYSDGSARYPSVSQVLDVLYPDRFAHVDQEVLAEAQARGTRRHLLFGVLTLYVAGLAPQPTIDPRDVKVADGLLGWIHRNNVTPLRVEEPSVNRQYGFAGTPDQQCLYGPKRIITLPDLKTGAQEDAHAIQVQAYGRLEGYTDTQQFMDLYVDDDGTVTERLVHLNPLDWCWFLAGLQVVKGQASRGII